MQPMDARRRCRPRRDCVASPAGYAAPMLDSAATALLDPLDRLRARWLRSVAPLVRPLIRSRELRVAVFGSAVVIAAFAGTVVAPLLMLALGPVVLGVPHVVSDVRYLVVRPGLHRDVRLLPAAALVGVAAVTASVLAGLAAAAAAVVVRTEGRRRGVALAALAVLAAGAAQLGALAPIVFAHAHNAIAIALWWAWRRDRPALQAVPVLLVLLGAVAILSGAADAGVARFAAALPAALQLDGHIAALAPGAEPALAQRLVLLFAFAQSVHYGIWLRLMPEDDRPRHTPRTSPTSVAPRSRSVSLEPSGSSAGRSPTSPPRARAICVRSSSTGTSSSLPPRSSSRRRCEHDRDGLHAGLGDRVRAHPAA